MERIRLDIIPKGLMPVCHASQYDDGRVIRLDLMDGLQGYSLTDEEIELNVRKPDGHIVTASVDVVAGNTFVDIVTTEQMCAVEGENICELKISKDDAEIYSLNFRMMVEKSVTEGGDPSESFIHNLHTQIAEGVAEEVATQYDSANVIFDTEPTENHGIGYTVTSEGIKTVIDNAFDYDNTASGSLVHITEGADNIPVKSLESEIVAVESGSGEKSPTNPYTISGFDSGVITRCGVNLWDEEWELGSIDNSGVDIPSSVQIRSKGYIAIKPGTEYYFNFPVWCVYYLYDANKDLVSRNINYLSKYSVTIPSNVHYLRFMTNYGAGITTYDNNISINYPSTDTQYHAYNGNTYTFAFGQTVYGGHFDNKGNLVVTHSFIASYNGETINEPWVSSMDNYVPNTSPSTGAQVVYPLTTPITLAITSQDIPTLLGENNIFSNCGDITVDYYTNKSNDILEFVDSEIGKKNGDNIPIEENSQDSIKDYVDNGLSGKADKTELVKFFDLTASSSTSDSGISPFSYYGQITKTDSDIHNILAVSVIDTQFNNPSIAVFYGQSGSAYTFMVYSARSGNVKIRVAYN